MKRSTPEEVSSIYEQLATAAGLTGPADGKSELNKHVAFWEKRGYQLTPYFEGKLYLTWTTFSFPPRFYSLPTSPEELISSPRVLAERAVAAESKAA